MRLTVNDQGSYEIPGLVTSAITDATTRDHPLDDEYIAKLATAVSTIPGLRAEYFSAGQDEDCHGTTNSQCVGSTRHNVEEDGYGRTADVRLYLNGELLLPGNEEHQEVIAEFLSTAVSLGLNEIGVDSRPGNSMIHVGYNNAPAAWGYGPDGSGKNIHLEDIYRDAYNEGQRTEYAGALITNDSNTQIITTSSTNSNPFLDLFNSIFPEEESTDVLTTSDDPDTPIPPGTIPNIPQPQTEPQLIDVVGDTLANIFDTVTGIFTGGTGTPSPSVPDSLVSDNSSNNDSNDNRNNLLSANDIQKVLIHTGVELECPDLQGISQNGYVYTVSFVGSNEVIRRNGCGVGLPNVFAQAIADDLNKSGLFQAVTGSQLIPKMEFKFYKP